MKKIIAVAGMLVAGMLFADTTPIMVSLVTPVQAPSRYYDVTGFRLSLIYGDCQEFTGLDIGIVDHADRDFTGIAIGGVNIADGRLYGGQLGLVNWNGHDTRKWDRRSIGAQLGIFNYANTFCGLQDGFANVAGRSFTGLQSGFLNSTRDLDGLQCGFYLLFGVNMASGTMRGCQIGLVNYAERVDGGLQLGFVNIISENGWLPVLPIVNGHF